MNKSRYYFRIGDDTCYKIESHLAYMVLSNITKMNIVLAERDINSDYFFCQHYKETGEKGQCGKSCDAYSPRNGKSGACKFVGYVYSETDKVYELKIDDVKIIKP